MMMPRRTVTEEEGIREFMVVLRRALLMIVRWIERRYDLSSD